MKRLGYAAVAALLLFVWQVPASAEEAAPPAGKGVEEIVVTGSYIVGTPKDAALPVDVITNEDLQRRGDPSAMDMIRAMPYVGPIMGESNQFAGDQGIIGTGSINLRGLGGQRTLILQNGRRTTYTPAEGPQGVDTNLLPMEAMGRVEILKDGAAAIYGSDAIAGVVNFITRRDLDGLDIGVDYRQVDHSDGDKSAHINWGWQGDDGSNFLLSLAAQTRGELKTTDRNWAFPPYLVNPTGWSSFSTPGTFRPRDAAFLPVAPSQIDANCADLGGFQSGGACRFSFIPYDNLVEKTEMGQGYAEMNMKMGETSEFHVEGLYAQTKLPNYRTSPGYPPTSGPNGPGGGQFFVPDLGPTPFANNPGALEALQQAGLTPAQIAATKNVGLELYRPFGWGGIAQITGGNGGEEIPEQYTMGRVSASLKGDLGTFSFLENVGYDVAVTYSDSTFHRSGADVQINRLKNALAGLGGPNCNNIPFGSPGSTCLAFNPFANGVRANPALGLRNPGFDPANENPAELITWLKDYFRSEFEQTLLVYDGVLNGETGIKLPGGNLGWAVGAQYRLINFDSTTTSPLQDTRITPCPIPGDTTCAFHTGPNIFLGQFLPQDLDQSVYAAFTELSIPVLDSLSAQVAVRYEDYGGLTGDTTDPKLSVRWQATDFLTLRGSVGTTFRGPTPLNVAARGITGLQPLAVAANQYRSIDFVGNPALQPETADTYSVGFIATFGGFRAIVDYWSYKFEDQIVAVPYTAVANAVGTLPGVPANPQGTQLANCNSGLRNLVTFNLNDTCIQGVTTGTDIARILSNVTNGPKVETTGVDSEVTYDFGEVFDGALTTGVSATYVDKYKVDPFIFGGVLVTGGYDAVGFANYDRNPGTISQWRAIANINYARGPLNFRYEARYVQGVTDNRGGTFVQPAVGPAIPNNFGLHVDSFVSHNIIVGAELPWGIYSSLSVMNLTDEDPPEARLQLSYDPYISDPYGRTVQLLFKKEFGAH